MADVILGDPQCPSGYHSDRKLPPADRKKWEASVDKQMLRNEVNARLGPVCDERNRRITKDEVLDEAFDRYLKLLHEQNSWRQDVHGKAFQEAILKVPNLTNAGVQCTLPSDKYCNDWPVWNSIFQLIYVGPDQWRKRYKSPDGYEELAAGQATICLLEAVGHRNLLASSGKPQPIVSLDHRTAYERTCCENTMCMDTRVRDEDDRPETPPSAAELEVEALHSDSEEYTTKRKALTPSQDHEWLEIPRAPDGRAIRHNSRMTKILHAFDHITDLKITRMERTGTTTLVNPCRELHRFLQGATKLKRLELDIGLGMSLDSVLNPRIDTNPGERHKMYDTPRHDFPLFLFGSSETVWPELQHLSLSINVPTPDLLSFLKAHAATLRSLELKRMLVQDVPTLLEQIPVILKLERVKIQYLWHDGRRLATVDPRAFYVFDPQLDDEVYLRL